MKKLSWVIICLLFSQFAFACKVAQWSPKQRFEQADAVYQGVVYGIEVPALAKDVSYKETAAMRYMNKHIKVAVRETIKGFKHERLEVNLHWCGGGDASIGQSITLYRQDDFWHAAPHLP